MLPFLQQADCLVPFQLGKRAKPSGYRAKLTSCIIASAPLNQHFYFFIRAKQAHSCAKQFFIISISRNRPGCVDTKFELFPSSFRAYYELFP